MDFEEDLKKASGLARAVVAKRVAVIAFVTILLNLAVANGWITGDLSNQAIGTLVALFNALGAVTAVAVIQPKVTPVDDPRANDGTPLVPETAVVAAPVEAEDAEETFDESKVGEDAGFVQNSPEATDNDASYVPEHAAAN